MFSAAVRSSLARILSQVQWWSISMVTRYDVKVVKPFLSESKCFQLISTIKVNLVAKSCIVLIHVLFFMSSMKKSPFLAVLTWCLILGKIPWRLRWRPLLVTSQASSSATTHKIYLILLRRSKAFYCFEILQHIKNSRGGFHPSPPHLYHGGGLNLRVRPRVNKD